MFRLPTQHHPQLQITAPDFQDRPLGSDGHALIEVVMCKYYFFSTG